MITSQVVSLSDSMMLVVHEGVECFVAVGGRRKLWSVDVEFCAVEVEALQNLVAGLGPSSLEAPNSWQSNLGVAEIRPRTPASLHALQG